MVPPPSSTTDQFTAASELPVTVAKKGREEPVFMGVEAPVMRTVTAAPEDVPVPLPAQLSRQLSSNPIRVAFHAFMIPPFTSTVLLRLNG